MYVEVSPHDFLVYAANNKFHSIVIEFIQTHPDYLYDFESQRKGSVYANPASWERVSNLLWGYEYRSGISSAYNDLEHLVAGLLNVSMTRLFIEFARERKDISPKDIFHEYPKVRGQVKEYMKDRNYAKLGELMIAFTTFLTSARPDYTQTEQKNIIDFLTDIPIDTAALFVSQLDELGRSSDEFKYVTRLHMALMKMSDKYKKDFYEPIVSVGRGKNETK